MNKCQVCEKTFSTKYNLKKHERRICLRDKSIKCQICDTYFATQIKLTKHFIKMHSGVQSSSSSTASYKCISCNLSFSNNSYKSYVQHLHSDEHLNNIIDNSQLDENIFKIDNAFKSRMITFKIVPKRAQNEIAIGNFLLENIDCIVKLLRNILESYGANLKFNLELYAHFVKANFEKDLKRFIVSFKNITISSNLQEILHEMFADIIKKMEEFQEKDSGWALQSISHLLLNVNKNKIFQSASSYIPLPKNLLSKNHCLNIINTDLACFAWCIVAHLFPTEENAEYTFSYPLYSNVLNLSNLNFPIKLCDIVHFENLNNISVNVYGIEVNNINDKYEIVGPLYFTKHKRDVHVNLLLIEDTLNNSHYVLIKSLAKLVSSQMSSKHYKYLCDGCLTFFITQEKLESHCKKDCNRKSVQVPTTDFRLTRYGTWQRSNILKYQCFEKELKVPFVIYADFESILEPINTSATSKNTVLTHVHKPFSFSYYVKCSYDNTLDHLHYYSGLDCIDVFISTLEREIKNIYDNHLKIPKPIKPLIVEEIDYNENSQICCICKNELIGYRVRHHCHCTGQFIGPAHNACNLNCKLPNFIPIILHNLSGYDSHLFFEKLCTPESQIEVIGKTKENYISFSKTIVVDTFENSRTGRTYKKYIEMRFLDSFKFLSSSLDSLAKTLLDSEKVNLKGYCENEAQFKLCSKKGVFCYEYIDKFEKLQETKLPPIECFNSKLNETTLTQSEYEHALNVWNTFNCSTLLDYAEIYVRTDVLLLADVFENFVIIYYLLDPVHFYTAPSLAWHAMLRYTKIELELLTDIDMIHFIKKNIRGGISQCIHRYAEANNKYMSNYDSTKQSSYISYWDVNNLYGWAMKQKLPVRDFVWLHSNEIEQLDIYSYDDDDNYGYILEVDLEYPNELHDLHNEFPFLSNKCNVSGSNVDKLICDLKNKEKYVIDIRMLKYALINGIKLKKIHRCLKFYQENFMSSFVDLNVNLRCNAKTLSEKNFYKLIINANFGKTMENVEKYRIIKVLTHWDNIRQKLGAQYYIKKINFHSSVIINENLAIIELQKLKIFYNKPIYIGFCILELSKLHMYKFFYNFVKPTFGSNSQLCYMDTDSFILHITVDDIFEVMKSNLSYFDTSNFACNNKYNIPLVNKSVVGLMKDELHGQICTHFIGLKSKMYALKYDDVEYKKIKGIKKCIVEKNIHFENYKKCLFEFEKVSIQQIIFKSKEHVIYNQLQSKNALSAHDDKRFGNINLVNTIAWGHYTLNQLTE